MVSSSWHVFGACTAGTLGADFATLRWRDRRGHLSQAYHSATWPKHLAFRR